VRYRLGQIGHVALAIYSSDIAFSIAANVALAVVLMLVLTGLVVTFLPRPATSSSLVGTPPPTCSWLEGRLLRAELLTVSGPSAMLPAITSAWVNE
jgi:hypothetical protein